MKFIKLWLPRECIRVELMNTNKKEASRKWFPGGDLRLLSNVTRDTDVQSGLLDSVGRRRGWDVSGEQHRSMCIIEGKTDHQPRLDARDKCLGLMHWEDPEESGGEGGGRGDRDGEYM